MATTTQRPHKPPTSAEQADVVPQAPQITPPAFGGDYSPFVWQQLSDIQKTLGRLESSVDSLSTDIQKVEGRLDETNTRLSGVTHKIYAASVVLMILIAVGGFIVNKAWDMMARVITDRPAAALSSPSAPPPVATK